MSDRSGTNGQDMLDRQDRCPDIEHLINYHPLFARTDPTEERLVYFYNPVESLLQIGPTCGLVCLIQAKRFFRSNAEPSSVGALLEEARRLGLTTHGEMFSGSTNQFNHGHDLCPLLRFSQTLTTFSRALSLWSRAVGQECFGIERDHSNLP